MVESLRVYPHRANVDGTHDAICPDCLKTISTQNTEALLGRSERNHTCNPIDVEFLWKAPPFYVRR